MQVDAADTRCAESAGETQVLGAALAVAEP
jgi:hypothetical protein